MSWSNLRGRALPRRLLALYVGLLLYGFSMATMIVAGLGLNPWDVFHQGVLQHVAWSFGTVTAVTGAAVLLMWIPLRQRPGLGTVSNVVIVAVAVDLGLAVLPELHGYPLRVGALIGGVVLNGFATALYISAGLGPGPRDGLMTGIVARTGWSVRLVRTGIEASVLAGGWVLGGTVGVGTVLYAVAIGPLAQLFMRLLPPLVPTPPALPQSSGTMSVPVPRMPTDTP